MWLTWIQGLEVFVALFAGLLATVGAVVAFALVAGLVHRVAAMAGRFLVSRLRTPEVEGRALRDRGPSAPEPSFASMPDPALYARQAWWRLRC